MVMMVTIQQHFIVTLRKPLQGNNPLAKDSFDIFFCLTDIVLLQMNEMLSARLFK